jgi:hypothetical protein
LHQEQQPTLKAVAQKIDREWMGLKVALSGHYLSSALADWQTVIALHSPGTDRTREA